MKTRLLAAAAVLVSAGVHLYMWSHGVRHQSVGPAFLLNFAGGVVIAILLITWRHWLPLLMAVGFGLSTIGAFTIAATVGLYGVHDHWTGGYVWTALISEVIAILAAVLAAWQEGWLARARHPRRQPLGRPLPH